MEWNQFWDIKRTILMVKMWLPCLFVNSISISPLTTLASRTTDQEGISRIANRVNYTSAYKKAMSAQAYVGARMTMVSEK